MKSATFIGLSVAALSACVIGLSACGSPSPAERQDASAPELGESGGETLGPDYLAGPWCHLYTKAGDDREEENRNYVFSEDGTFAYQVSEYNPEIGGKGTYKINGEEITISPVFSAFKLKVLEVQPDDLVLNPGFGAEIHFTRGACE
jgi:hypothetical protein